MTDKRAVAAGYCIYLDVNMMFLTLFAFSTLLVGNAVSSADTTYTNLPLQEMVPRTISDKSSVHDVPRKEIVEAVQTGRRKTSGDFQRILTNLLLLNLSSPISDTDLGLWISALVARGDNPRNQNGIDMVADLLTRVNSKTRPMTYLVLTLCNSRAVTHGHLEKIVKYTSNLSVYNTTRQLELDSLVLKTLACAATLPNAHKQKLDQFNESMHETAKKISFAQASGYFDNIYTTSLVVQALTAYNQVMDAALEWGEKEALNYLRRESTDSVTKLYYISIALNARRVPFLKDLHKETFDSQMTLKKDISVTLSLRNEAVTEDFALQLKVPGNWNLFKVLLRASNFSSRFRFVHFLNKNGEPQIIELDNTPNDPERGLYWTICIMQRTENNFANQILNIPFDGENITVYYGSEDCPIV